MERDSINSNSSPASARFAQPYLTSRIKRTADVVVSVIGVLVFIAMLPLIGLVIKLDSRGPIFYRQTRLGIDGQIFVLIKFRTMIRDAEANGEAVWASIDDPRVTRIGRCLRKLYIDEFPQWWNVLKGDMSVVGPRPERPEMAELIVQQYPGFSVRLEAKPGITGLAQTEYRYANSLRGSRHKLNFDQVYIKRASLLLDSWIILRTLRRMLLRRGT